MIDVINRIMTNWSWVIGHLDTPRRNGSISDPNIISRKFSLLTHHQVALEMACMAKLFGCDYEHALDRLFVFLSSIILRKLSNDFKVIAV